MWARTGQKTKKHVNNKRTHSKQHLQLSHGSTQRNTWTGYTRTKGTNGNSVKTNLLTTCNTVFDRSMYMYAIQLNVCA